MYKIRCYFIALALGLDDTNVILGVNDMSSPRYDKTFKFEHLDIEIKTAELPYTRRTGAAAGVTITVTSNYSDFSSNSFHIRPTSNFPTKGKKQAEIWSSSHRETDREQACGLNKLTHLTEIVKQDGNDNEKKILEELVNNIKSLLNAVCKESGDKVIKQYVIPGQRINEETFEVEVEKLTQTCTR